jgi:mono/diheme cytochrome c family protein
VTRALVVTICLLVLVACRTDQTIVTPDPHLERMLRQEKRLPYDRDPALPEGMTMLKPPGETLTVDAPIDPRVDEGVADGHWVGEIPVVLDRSAIEDGQRAFDVFCAACHGELGDGDSVVAFKMNLVRPRDLQSEAARAYPAGRIFEAIRQGYGMMPSYRVQLGVERTWRVVAYVRALQLARGVPAADLPPEMRAQLAQEAP